LALLRTELELAVRRPRSADELTAAVESAAEEVDRLIRLAEDLLLLASSDEDGLCIDPQGVEVAPLLSAVVSRFRSLAISRARTLTVTATVERCQADRLRLEQALVNLVSNAFDHGAGEIVVSACAVADGTEFRVTDSGPGFSESMLERGFERFAHNPAKGGSGLGLAIVAAVAKAHGGSAGLGNRAEGGSVVWIRLPR
jgi:signal transduction histidine kinase